MTTLTRAALFSLFFAACSPIPGGLTGTTGGGTTGGGNACTPGAAQGSCAYNDTGEHCDELSGYGQTYVSSFMSDCTGNTTRSYSASACSHTNNMGQKTVGACSISLGGGCFTTWSFPPRTAADEMMGCQIAGGTWTPAQ